MENKFKIQVSRASRKGSQRVRAIVVVTLPPHVERDEIVKTRERVKEITPDRNGILWLITSEDCQVKVYPKI